MSNKRNRDVVRQNKATSVVAGTIYSNISKDGINSMAEMSKIVLESDNNKLSEENKSRLQYISEQGKSSVECIDIAANMYMRSSTYVRCGAKDIASKAQNTMKNAIRFNEVANLKKPTSHITPNMVKMQRVIRPLSGKLPCSTQPLEDAASPDISIINQRIEEYRHICHLNHQIHCSNPGMPTFFLPIPTAKYYTPLQAVTTIKNCANRSIRLILDLPKDRLGQHVMKKVTKTLIINIMVKKIMFQFKPPIYSSW